MRQLRVMVEHLPRDSAWHRDANGPWGDLERLVHDVDSQLRAQIVLLQTISGALKTGFKLTGGSTPEPHLIPIPPSPREAENQRADAERVRAAEVDLLRVLNPD